MPIVTVTMFPGRTPVMKAFLARRIIDDVAELAGTAREGVHVIFTDIERGEWAIGPRLASMRATEPPTGDAAAYVTVGRIQVLPGKHDAYLAWRRDAVYPFMASHEGFISSTLLSVPANPDQYVIINKWASSAAQDEYTAKPREAELRQEARDLLSQLVTEELAGDVVDVFHRRTE